MELERQKIINQQQKTRAFASAAHEFRNPLNGANVALDLLDHHIVDPRARSYYTIAKNCNSLMSFLVKDILDYA